MSIKDNSNLSSKSNKVKKDSSYVQTSQVSNFVMPNSKISNILTDTNLETKEVGTLDNIFNTALNVTTLENKSKSVTTSCFISYDESVVLDKSKPFTEYDRAVYNAITSHFVAGNTVFSAAMVYRAMAGNNSKNPSPQQIGAVTRSITKMGGMRIKIDASSEFIKRGLLKEGDEWVRDEQLLYYTLDRVTINGKKAEAYTLIKGPILYSYAATIKQLITVPIQVLDTPSDNTEKTINMKNYLIRRIEGIRNPHNKLKSNSILLSKLYELTNARNNTEYTRVRKQCNIMLDYWVSSGFIKDFKFLKQKRTIYAIEVQV